MVLHVNLAWNWGECGGALRTRDAPSMSFVYATATATSDTICRGGSRSGSEGSGLVPVPGGRERTVDRMDPYQELPHLFNPAAGLHRLGEQPRRRKGISVLPHRRNAEWLSARRIVELLTEREKLTTGRFRAHPGYEDCRPAAEFCYLLTEYAPRNS